MMKLQVELMRIKLKFFLRRLISVIPVFEYIVRLTILYVYIYITVAKDESRPNKFSGLNILIVNHHFDQDIGAIADANKVHRIKVVEYWENGATLPPRCFAITFDDGFENNYSVAAPILKDLHVPATFYITTDFVENNSMSWIDRIECCLARVPQGSLHLPWERNEHCFQTAEEKIWILKRIREKAKLIKSIDVDWLVSDIFNQCGIDEIYSSNDQLDLKMVAHCSIRLSV